MARDVRRQPIYAVVRRMVDPATGEQVACFVPHHAIDFTICRERKYHTGKIVRLDVSMARNEVFHRATHVLGKMVADNVAGFEGMNAHAVLKKLQLEAGAFCEFMEIDLGALGKHQIKQARSIAYDSLSEEEFRELWRLIVAHLVANYWGGLEPAEIQEQSDLIAKTMPVD